MLSMSSSPFNTLDTHRSPHHTHLPHPPSLLWIPTDHPITLIRLITLQYSGHPQITPSHSFASSHFNTLDTHRSPHHTHSPHHPSILWTPTDHPITLICLITLQYSGHPQITPSHSFASSPFNTLDTHRSPHHTHLPHHTSILWTPTDHPITLIRLITLHYSGHPQITPSHSFASSPFNTLDTHRSPHHTHSPHHPSLLWTPTDHPITLIRLITLQYSGHPQITPSHSFASSPFNTLDTHRSPHHTHSPHHPSILRTPTDHPITLIRLITLTHVFPQLLCSGTVVTVI